MIRTTMWSVPYDHVLFGSEHDLILFDEQWSMLKFEIVVAKLFYRVVKFTNLIIKYLTIHIISCGQQPISCGKEPISCGTRPKCSKKQFSILLASLFVIYSF